ncbi:MAG: hypothetical protein R2873_26055 [Caldilineaceae bacterium]
MGLVTVGLAEDPRWRARLRLAASATPGRRRMAHRHRFGQQRLRGLLPAAAPLRQALRNTTAALIWLRPSPPRGEPRLRPGAPISSWRGRRARRTMWPHRPHCGRGTAVAGWITSLARFDLCQILDLCGRAPVSARRRIRVGRHCRLHAGGRRCWAGLPKASAGDAVWGVLCGVAGMVGA